MQCKLAKDSIEILYLNTDESLILTFIKKIERKINN